MKVDARLIRVPRAQPVLQRTAWGLVTLLAWLFYAYLWTPLATALMWWLGLRDMYGELYERSEHVDPFVVAVLPSLAILTACFLILWAEYNRLRFTGHERRTPFPDVPVDAIAVALGAEPDVAAALADARVAVLVMDGDARPVAVEPVRVDPDLPAA